MDAHFFEKHLLHIYKKTTEKKELILYIQTKTNLSLKEDELQITKKKVVFIVSSAMKTKLIQKNISFILQEKGYTIKISSEAKDFISDKGYDVQFGARPLKRAIQKYLEDTLAEEIIKGSFNEGDIIEVDLDKEKQEIKIKSTKPKETKPKKSKKDE